MRKNNSQNSYRQELRERILATAMNEFYTKGIKAVKMDDIAKRLSISKRTLYEIYQNKEELLLEGMKASEAEFDAHMKAFSFQQSNNVMDILIEFYHYQVTKFAKKTPAYYEDLHKYSLITEYLHSKQSERDKNASLFIKKGIQEGFFRADINYSIVTQIARESVHYAMMNQLYKEHSIQEVFSNIILLFIRGICTLKGLQRLEDLS